MTGRNFMDISSVKKIYYPISSKLRSILKKFKLVRWTYSIYRKARILMFINKYRIFGRIKKKKIVHFFHIGKTGGTSVKYALRNNRKPYLTGKYLIFTHPHYVSLKDTLPGEKIFFFIRDPVDRFVSGFYSRKRKGRPRYNFDWSSEEREAFDTFNTPNHLAISLTSNDGKIKRKAVEAMNGIFNVNSSYWDWFVNEEFFLERIEDILFVGDQKKLNEDFLRLKEILDLPDVCKLPEDAVHSHRNPDHFEKHLEPEAIMNLQKWYVSDYQFLRLLKDKKLI